MRLIAVCALALVCLASSSSIILTRQAHAEDAQWEDLFNGKDLTGWDTWLRAPEDQGGQKGKPIGLNKDPAGVFSVQDGVLRVSGEIFGCISSIEQFQDYHLRFDFRWGEKKWPPRLKELRDSGFLYHCYGRHGAFWNAWKACVEYQVQEGDVGDLIFLSGPGGKTLLTKGKNGRRHRVYNPLGDLVKAPRTRHSGKYEYPNGEWNTCQVIARDDDAVHIVNGFVINRVFDLVAKQDGEMKSLTSGQLQFQSEAAEIFYRRIQKRDLIAQPTGKGADVNVMQPAQAEVKVDESTVQLSYKNTGKVAVHIPAVEVLGEAAGDFHFDLPELPAVVAPAEDLQIGVRYHARRNQSKHATLRLEGLRGPIEASQIKLYGLAAGE